MAADKFTAAESIRRLAKQFEAMVEAADALEAMGKVEQSTAEAIKAQVAAQSERDAAITELKKAKTDVKAAQEKAAGIIAAANDQALATLSEADRKAQSILDGGAAQANKFIAAAVEQAEQAKSSIAGQVAQLTSTKANLEQNVSGLNQAAAVKAQEIEDLEKRLSKAQASIAKLLG